MAGVIVFLLILLFFGAVLGVAAAQGKRTNAAWARAAEELGLEFRPTTLFGRPQMKGTLDGLPVEVYTYSQRSGENSTTYTRYAVAYPPLGVPFELRHESGIRKVLKIFGIGDTAIGDARFDDSFAISTDDPDALRAYLTPARRMALLRLLASYPGLQVSDTGLSLTTKGTEKNGDVIVSTVRRLVATGRTLTDAHLSQRLDEAVEIRLDGDAGKAAETMRATVQPHPDDLDGRLTQMETLRAAGDTAEADAILDDLAERLPADPDVAGWRAARAGRSDRRAAAPGGSADGAISTDPLEIAEDLFAERRLSFETDARFDERYAGTSVRWQGVVRRVSRETADMDFPGGPITKAKIHIATIPNDLYGNTEVDAIVALPPDAADRLERDARVTFTGTLIKADGLVRNLYVADGRLVEGT